MPDVHVQQPDENLMAVLLRLMMEVEGLAQQVRTLTDSAQVLTAAIDDVRQEIEWATRNLGRPAWVPTSAETHIPADGVAENVAIHPVPRDVIPPETPGKKSITAAGTTRTNAVGGELF